jgi:hypothetical protein
MYNEWAFALFETVLYILQRFRLYVGVRTYIVQRVLFVEDRDRRLIEVLRPVH